MKELFDAISHEVSKMTTKRYSTSFSLGIRFLAKDLRKPTYAIYGFVRFADEIVDSFHAYDKSRLLKDFSLQTFDAIEKGVSLNPILNSFQWAVNEYQIPIELIQSFLDSMEMDLKKTEYNQPDYEQYILGSAEVVGLMCLKVFVRGNEEEYEHLKEPAMKLGAAFQKINFLRDLRNDYHGLGRTYFPGIELNKFNAEMKLVIETDIDTDFKAGYQGILKLPKNARFGVYLAYTYYHSLFDKIRSIEPEILLNNRVRIPNWRKYLLVFRSFLVHSTIR